MSKLDAQNEEFLKVLTEYHQTGNLSQEFFTHLESIKRYTSGLPQFKNYTEDWKQLMEEKAQERAVDALLKGKFNVRKRNPVSFFGNLYYNTYLNAIRDKKKLIAREAHNEDALPDGRPKYREPEPIGVAHDPVSLFSPFISWILIESKGEMIGERFLVFASAYYPELLSPDMTPSPSLVDNYKATFPSGAKPKRSLWNINNLMGQISKLRRKCNTHHNMSNEGLRNNLLGLKNIIEKRLRIGKE